MTMRSWATVRRGPRRGAIAVCGTLLLAACYVAVEPDGDVSVGVLEIIQQPADAAVAAGSSAAFSVGVAGTPPFTFQWRRDGQDIAGAVQAAWRTPALQQADDGAGFQVRVCNALLCRTSRVARLTVLR